MNYLPYISFPVDKDKIKLFLQLITNNQGSEKRKIISKLARILNLKEKTIEEYIRSFKNLGLIIEQGDLLSLSQKGEYSYENLTRNNWNPFKEHLEQNQIYNLIINAIKDLNEEGISFNSKKFYDIKLIEQLCNILVRKYNLSRIRRQSLSAYLRLFKLVGILQETVITKSEVTVSDLNSFYTAIKNLYHEIKENDPILRKVPWVDISEIENQFINEYGMNNETFLSYLFELKKRNLIALHLINQEAAKKMGIKTYDYGGYSYSTIKINGEKNG